MLQDAELMMHSPYLETDSSSIICASKLQSQNLKDYYIEMLGLKTGNLIFDRTMRYCDTNNGWRLNKDAAEVFSLLKKSDN